MSIPKKTMEWSYNVPWILRPEGKGRAQVNPIAMLPTIMLQAHLEMLAARPKGTTDDGEFGLVKAKVNGEIVELVFSLELPKE